MKDEQYRFLTLLGQLPARLTAEQAAWVLNCQVHDVPALIANRLLKPLGNPPANGIKYFSTSDVLELSKDRHWLTKATAAIYGHWHKRNSAKRSPQQNVKKENESADVPQNGHAVLISR